MSKQMVDDDSARKTSSGEELSDAALQHVTGGRGASSGMATGRRRFKPITIVKETDVSSSRLE